MYNQPAAMRAGQLAQQFSQYDAFHGCAVELVTPRERHLGVNCGIDATGALQLDTGAAVQSYPAGEISLLPA